MAQQLVIDPPAGDAGRARRRGVGRLCVAAALTAAAIGAFASGPGVPTASAQSDRTVSRVCSESGDSCGALLVRRGKVVAQHEYAERYRPTAKVCVRQPGRAWVCRTRPLQRGGSGASWVARFSMKARPGVWRMQIFPGTNVRLRVHA